MPELPEVEVLVRHLAPALTHRRIKSVLINRAKVLLPTRPEEFAREVAAALASPAEPERRRECARRHGWDASAARMVRLFEDLAASAPGAS